MDIEDIYKESFRDRIATISKEGRRLWIFAKKPSGKLTFYRRIVAYALFAFLMIAPHVKYNGEQFLLLNFLERKFVLFGVIFWPQDSYILFLLTISTLIFIVLFTTIFGRIWCGWACPQTVFLEHIFRPIEFLIDGSPADRRKLKEQKWNLEKIFKRGLKHGIFWIISFVIGNTFLAYFIGSDKLMLIVTDKVESHLTGFIATVIFTSVFYFIYSWFREQVCCLLCPYGRLQSALLDTGTISTTNVANLAPALVLKKTAPTPEKAIALTVRLA